MSVLTDVADALAQSRSGTTPSRLHKAMNRRWSLVSIRHALRRLCAEGRASFTGDDCHRIYSPTAGEAAE